MKKIWTEKEIVELLKKSDKAVCKGIVAIYNNQTVDEQVSDSTNHKNGIGFSGSDANILSSFAKFYLKNGYLSPKQLNIGRTKIVKYKRQLTLIANGEL